MADNGAGGASAADGGEGGRSSTGAYYPVFEDKYTADAMLAIMPFGSFFRLRGVLRFIPIPIAGGTPRWWPLISKTAPDWAVKGAHVLSSGVELAIRPDKAGNVVVSKFFAHKVPAARLADAVKRANAALEDVGFRQRLYNMSGRAIELAPKSPRAAELRHLMHALKRMGI